MRVKLSLWLLLSSLLFASPVLADGPSAVVTLRAHDGHGRPFDLSQLRGEVVAITFASRYTREEADRVHNQLVNHTARGDMLVVNVVDLMGVPSWFHGYARRKAAEHDREGRILHVIDEGGELRRAFQADPGKRVDILVIDRDGHLRGRFVGTAQLDAALELVERLRSGSASPALRATRSSEVR